MKKLWGLAFQKDSLLKMNKLTFDQRIEKRLKHFKKHPIPPLYKPRLSDSHLPPPMWNHFYRQKPALEHAKSMKHAKVFSVESERQPSSGARHYVVSGLEEFWSYYKNMIPTKRHFYELIEEDAPCHLYFDLEFDKTVNPSVDGESMVDLWISYTCFCLKRLLNVIASRSNVIELDSTTEKKFSQHLVWHIPNAVFENNLEAGKFVKEICNDLLSYVDMRKSADKTNLAKHWIHSTEYANKLDTLLINKGDEKKSIFVDEGVYTRNRNFRLYLSSKKGKMTELQYSINCQFKLEPVDLSLSCCTFHTHESITNGQNSHTNMCEDQQKLIFFSSLVTNVHIHDHLVFLKLNNIATFPSKAEFTTILPVKKSVSNVSLSDLKDFSSLPSDIPFQQLHQFVTEYVKQFNTDAHITKVNYSSDVKCIFYDIAGTRYCHNIGREHKSNRIYIMINLNSKMCYHRCYDYECQATSSRFKVTPLPPSVLSRMTNDTSNFDDGVGDNELVNFVEKLEEN